MIVKGGGGGGGEGVVDGGKVREMNGGKGE